MFRTLEPFAYGYMNCKSLYPGMKIAEGMYSMCKYIPLVIDPEIGLASFDRSQTGEFYKLGIAYSYGDGIMCNKDNIDKRIESYPAYKDKFTEIYNYFKYKETYKIAWEKFTETDRKLNDNHTIFAGLWGGHSNPNYGLIPKIGTDGARKKIKKYMEVNPHSTEFYKASLIVLDGIDLLAERMRELALSLADKNDTNRELYIKIADALSIVPKKPAYDFFTACQSFYLVSSFDGNDSPACFDQYMIEYWRKTNYTEARRILEGLWQGFQKARIWNMCISGSDEAGNDLTNELSYEILDVAAKYKYNTPNLTMRVHSKTPDKLWHKATETLSTGIGMPVIYNDEVVCPALEDLGIPKKDSHKYVMNGCNQFDIFGKSHMGLEDGEVCLLKCLEYALNNGRCLITDECLGLETGDASEFSSYEKLFDAYKQQVDYVVKSAVRCANTLQQVFADTAPNPLRSILIEGCIEKGMDYKNGGPLYNHGQILTEGLADTVDSLAVIRHFVFNEKKYTMSDIITAMKCDYDGFEDMRLEFADFEGKFGNDIEWVDKIARDVQEHYFKLLLTHNTYRGGKSGIYGGGLSTFNRTGFYAGMIGASANGRHKSDVHIADSCGACPGKDTHGPTALIKSALKYNQRLAKSGFVLQIKFDKKLFSSEKGKDVFEDLAKTYFEYGGQQLTVSVLSAEELLDAVKHPERHKNLIVRVGGFSAYFVNLNESLQKNIIARTMHLI